VDKKITVLEVLYQVGFNSKSSFNTVFKKQTGLTPSEFKKKMAG
jgi:AraC-like DNA-binding protein